MLVESCMHTHQALLAWCIGGQRRKSYKSVCGMSRSDAAAPLTAACMVERPSNGLVRHSDSWLTTFLHDHHDEASDKFMSDSPHAHYSPSQQPAFSILYYHQHAHSSDAVCSTLAELRVWVDQSAHSP